MDIMYIKDNSKMFTKLTNRRVNKRENYEGLQKVTQIQRIKVQSNKKEKVEKHTISRVNICFSIYGFRDIILLTKMNSHFNGRVLFQHYVISTDRAHMHASLQRVLI